MNDNINEIENELRRKEGVLESYSSIYSAPSPLLSSIRGLEIQLAYARYEREDITYDQLQRELQRADERFKDILQPLNYFRVTPQEKKPSNDDIIKRISNYPQEFKSLPQEYRDNLEIAKVAIMNDENNIQYVSPRLQDNKELVLLALRYNGECLMFASPRLQKDPMVVMAALNSSNKNNFSLKNIFPEIRNNKAVVLKALEVDGLNLQYASDELRDDYAVVMEAVRNNGLALQYASKRLKNNEDIVAAAIKQNKDALEFTSDRIKNLSSIQLERTYKDPFYMNQEVAYSLVNEEFIKLSEGFNIDYASPTSFETTPEDVVRLFFQLDDYYERGLLSDKAIIKISAYLLLKDALSNKFEDYDDIVKKECTKLLAKLNFLIMQLIKARTDNQINNELFEYKLEELIDDEIASLRGVCKIVDLLPRKNKGNS